MSAHSLKLRYELRALREGVMFQLHSGLLDGLWSRQLLFVLRIFSEVQSMAIFASSFRMRMAHRLLFYVLIGVDHFALVEQEAHHILRLEDAALEGLSAVDRLLDALLLLGPFALLPLPLDLVRIGDVHLIDYRLM